MLALIGLCQGYYLNQKEIRGQNGPTTISEHSVLIMVEESNKYGIVEQKIKEIRLSKKHMEGGLNHLWDQLKGKQVSVPVFIQSWASKAGNSGYDYWLSGDGKPLNLQQVKSTPAAA